jgi:hypothetical protein
MSANKKTIATAFFVAGAVLGAPQAVSAAQWVRFIPAAACLPDPTGVVQNDLYTNDNGNGVIANKAGGNPNGFYVPQLYCPFVLENNTDNAGDSWKFMDSDVHDVRVDVEVAGGDFVEAWACLEQINAADCGSGVGTSTSGPQSIRLSAPSAISLWTQDRAPFMPYVKVNLSNASTLWDVVLTSN